ncbi:hypothetical protein [Pseudocnuella soli]|uniref:hypothetical protein n=1 Tax=Pseudocnuella soli TaxID=2502779 RepID=UPI00104FCCFE|nr:hypothetical protein [Pseudocnuella soli]
MNLKKIHASGKKPRFGTILLFIRSLFFILGKLSFVLFILFVGFFAFYINDQGLDLMAAFGANSFRDDYQYSTLFVFFLFIWANTIWNVSRVLLGSANLIKVIQHPVKGIQLTESGRPAPDNYLAVCIDERYLRIIYQLYIWVPRVLIFLPYIIFISSWLKENDTLDTMPILVIFLAVAHFLFITFRLKIVNQQSAARQKATMLTTKELVRKLEEEQGFLQSLRDGRVFKIAILSLVATIGMFGYALVSAFYANPLGNGRPSLIILSALTFYTVVLFLIRLGSKATKLPLLMILLILALLFARWNNNHRVEILNTDNDRQLLTMRDGLPDTIYFQKWLAYKEAKGIYKDSAKDNTIFLIAAEGGGIRACYWTETVLRKIQERQPQLYDKTFAVTGASGGSVGLGFYYSYLYQNRDAFRRSGHRNLSLTEVGLDSICTSDFLSRVTFGLLYQDLWQRFLPVAIENWDRGKYLGQSFDGAFSSAHGSPDASLLSGNYLQMWSGVDRFDYPAILFNTLYVEKGSKAVFSPFKLSSGYYPDVLDILSVTKRSVTFRECMVSTARFPFVTPPGYLVHDKIQDSNADNKPSREEMYGHIIDGGGFDNKAVQTAQQTAIMLKEQLQKTKNSNNFKVVILYIGYGQEPLFVDNSTDETRKAISKSEDPLSGNYELAPLIGGSNTVFRWIFSAHGMAVKLDSTLNVIDFSLRSKRDSIKHVLPLGWYLSPYSKRIIRSEVDSPHVVKSIQHLQELSKN